MNITNRIQKLERTTSADKPERKTWVIVNGELEPDGIVEIDTVIRVVDEETRKLTLRILAGERTGSKSQ